MKRRKVILELEVCELCREFGNVRLKMIKIIFYGEVTYKILFHETLTIGLLKL